MLQKTSWSEIAERVSCAAPRFKALIDGLGSVAKAAPLYLASYNYGSLIVNDGGFCLPQDSREELKAEVEAAVDLPIPLALVLDGAVEVFLAAGERTDGSEVIVPLRLVSRGEFFGLFEFVDRLCGLNDTAILPRWSVSSGARSASLILKWGDTRFQEELAKRLGVRFSTVRDEFMALDTKPENDSWQILKLIASKAAPSWSTELLLIPRQWTQVDHDNAVAAALLMRLLLHELSWRQSEYLRRIVVLDPFIHKLRHSSSDVHLAPKRDLVLAHVRQLIAVSHGHAPAFRPVTDDLCGPFTSCQALLKELHTLGHYPVVLEPCHMTNKQASAYYSLNTPNILTLNMEESESPAKVVRSVVELGAKINVELKLFHASFLFEGHHSSSDKKDASGVEPTTRALSWRSNVTHAQLASDLLPNNVGDLGLAKRHRFLIACGRITLPDQAGTELRDSL